MFSHGRINKCMLDAMTAFLTCISQQCLADIGCSTGVGVLSPDSAYPDQVLLATREVPQAQHTISLSPRP